MKVLLTGATGFVGQALVDTLIADGYEIVAAVRQSSSALPAAVNQLEIGDLSWLSEYTSPPFCRIHSDDVIPSAQDRTGNETSSTKAVIASEAKQSSHTDETGLDRHDLRSRDDVKDIAHCDDVENLIAGDAACITEIDNLKRTLQTIDIVIHTAARVHIMNDKAADPLAEFRKVNVNATIALAWMAAEAGVKRFVFLSTAKVNGESTLKTAFREADCPAPHDAYAMSKWEAEQALRQIAAETGMEVVIIRPPLIYGPGVKGNFASMMRWIQKGIPLPMGAVDNKRSLLALDNLMSFISLCMTHPQAANETFLIADGEDVSTPELLRRVASALGKKARLMPVPVGLMKFVAMLLGKNAVAERLFGSLQLDISKARDRLGWEPVISMEQQLVKMAGGETHQRPSEV